MPRTCPSCCGSMRQTIPSTDEQITLGTSDRTTGGSSGGEGALIASGASPLGIGTDSGGSGRSPAHFCGINALKPTSGLLSTQGSLDDIIFAGQEAIINQPAPMARYVCDLELLFNVLSAPGDTWLDTAVTDRRPSGPAEVSRCSIGYFGACTGYPVAEEVLSTLDHAASQLEAAGVHCTQFLRPI